MGSEGFAGGGEGVEGERGAVAGCGVEFASRAVFGFYVGRHDAGEGGALDAAVDGPGYHSSPGEHAGA